MKIKKNEQGKIYFEFNDELDYIYFCLVERKVPKLTFTHESTILSEMDDTEQALIDGVKNTYNIDIETVRDYKKHGAYEFIIKLKD